MVLEEHGRDGVESEPVESKSIDAEVKVGPEGGKSNSASCYPRRRRMQSSQEEAEDLGLPVIEDAAGNKREEQTTRQSLRDKKR